MLKIDVKFIRINVTVSKEEIIFIAVFLMMFLNLSFPV